MACTRPLNAYRVNGKIFYTPSLGAEFIQLPCGQCVNCRLIAIPTLGLRWRVRNLQNCTMFTTVRSLMVEAGLWIPRTQRAPKIQLPHYRQVCCGELIRDHHRFETVCLLVLHWSTSTSRLMQFRFVKSEATFTYFEASGSPGKGAPS